MRISVTCRHEVIVIDNNNSNHFKVTVIDNYNKNWGNNNSNRQSSNIISNSNIQSQCSDNSNSNWHFLIRSDIIII